MSTSTGVSGVKNGRTGGFGSVADGQVVEKFASSGVNSSGVGGVPSGLSSMNSNNNEDVGEGESLSLLSRVVIGVGSFLKGLVLGDSSESDGEIDSSGEDSGDDTFQASGETCFNTNCDNVDGDSKLGGDGSSNDDALADFKIEGDFGLPQVPKSSSLVLRTGNVLDALKHREQEAYFNRLRDAIERSGYRIFLVEGGFNIVRTSPSINREIILRESQNSTYTNSDASLMFALFQKLAIDSSEESQQNRFYVVEPTITEVTSSSDGLLQSSAAAPQTADSTTITNAKLIVGDLLSANDSDGDTFGDKDSRAVEKGEKSRRRLRKTGETGVPSFSVQRTGRKGKRKKS